MARSPSARAPTLLCIVGPVAVGKMTVGHEIAARTGFRLFHNHLTIEPVLRFFEFGSPPFVRLVGEFRRRLIEEVAASDLPGLIFTFVWAFDLPSHQAALEGYALPFRHRGGRVLYVELQASQQERLSRCAGALRLADVWCWRCLLYRRACHLRQRCGSLGHAGLSSVAPVAVRA